MSDDKVTFEMSIPLDSDGFLHRECPTCDRQFKWHHMPIEDGSSAPVADGGYFCPYCGVQAETNTWLTQAQVELAQSIVVTRAVGPMLKKFGNDLKRIGGGSRQMIRADVTYNPPDELDPLTEVDDMTRIDFNCHPTEPVKVVDGWENPVRCLICGQPNV